MDTPKSQRTKQRIVDAALVLFMEKGFDIVTIDMICDAGDIVKNTFYYHFKSKEELFTTCIGSQKDLSMNALSQILLSDAPYFEKFWQMQKPRFEFIANCGPEVMQYLCRIPSDKLLALMDEEDDVHQVEINLLKKAQTAGEIRNSAEPDVLLGVARIQLLGTLILASTDRRYSFSSLARAGFEVVFNVRPELRVGDTKSIRIMAADEKEEL